MAQKRGFNLLLARHYDKAIAVVVLIALLISLFLLARSAAESKERKRNYEDGMKRMRPKHAILMPRDVAPYEAALRSLRHPQTMRASTNETGLFIPQKRAWCVDCLYPILLDSLECPFCRAKQPRDTNTTTYTKDDPEDHWRKKTFGHTFAMEDDLSRPGDDADHDGFSNHQEFLENTDPRDPKGHPDLMALIRFKAFSVRTFPFVIQGANNMPDGLRPIFLMNGRVDATIKKGQQIGKTGLAYTNCVKFSVRVNDPRIGPHNEDRYEVELFRLADGKRFTLRDNDPQAIMDQEIVLLLVVGEKTTEYRVSAGNLLELDGQKYKVELNLVIDDKPTSVVLENIHTGKKLSVSAGSL